MRARLRLALERRDDDVTGALKEGVKGLEHELGFFAGGGKGGTSRKTPGKIVASCETLSLDPRPLVYASRLAAKVDSAAVQHGYQLYHHAFFFTAGSPLGRRSAGHERRVAHRAVGSRPGTTRDPARFAFAHGGKDGAPFPVDRATYDRTIDALHDAVARAKVDRSEKVDALKALVALRQSNRTEPGR